MSYGPQNSPLFNAAPSGTAPLGTTTGSSVFNFGGINLGTQTLPTTLLGGSTNTPATVGTTATPLSQPLENYLPLLLVAIAALAIYLYER